jgi:hypothetical protein
LPYGAVGENVVGVTAAVTSLQNSVDVGIGCGSIEVIGTLDEEHPSITIKTADK